MLFVLNTSVDSHFCALFDEDKNLIEKISWEDRKQDGSQVFEFLEKHPEKLTFIGGVTGPGGFSCLRAASGILNALAKKYDLPIHQIRADQWMRTHLSAEHAATPILLNSFSSRLFVAQDEELIALPVAEAAEKFQGQPVFSAALPADKQELFQMLNISLEKSEQSLLEALQASAPKDFFVPDYEYPAV